MLYLLKGPFTLHISVHAIIALAILVGLNYFAFLINQKSCSKNGLRSQLIRYNASVDADAIDQSSMLSVNGPVSAISSAMAFACPVCVAYISKNLLRFAPAILQMCSCFKIIYINFLK